MRRVVMQGILDNLAESLAAEIQNSLLEKMKKYSVLECRFDLLRPLEAQNEFQIQVKGDLLNYRQWLFHEMEIRKIRVDELATCQICVGWTKKKISTTKWVKIELVCADGSRLESRREGSFC